MVEFIRKFESRRIKIARVNSILITKSTDLLSLCRVLGSIVIEVDRGQKSYINLLKFFCTFLFCKCGDKNFTAHLRSGQKRDLYSGRNFCLFMYLKFRVINPSWLFCSFSLFVFATRSLLIMTPRSHSSSVVDNC